MLFRGEIRIITPLVLTGEQAIGWIGGLTGELFAFKLYFFLLSAQ